MEIGMIGRRDFFKVVGITAANCFVGSEIIVPKIAFGGRKKRFESFSRFGINNPFEENDYGLLPAGAAGLLKDLGGSGPIRVSDSIFRRRVEAGLGDYDGASARNKLGVYKKAGAEILFVINPKSNFVFSDGFKPKSGGYLPGGPESFAAYERFLIWLVNLCKGKVAYFEIFNEPTDEYKISKGVYRINDYVELVVRSFKIIKSIDPQVQVVLGGIATRSPLDFYELVLTELKNYYPEILSELIFDVHTYSRHWHNWDRYYERGSQTDFRTFETFANLFGGFVDNPRFIIKEGGTFSGKINDVVEFPYTSPEEVFQTEYEQAELLFKSRVHLASQPGVIFVQWSTFVEHGDYQGNCESQFSHGGLICDGTDDECGVTGDPYDGGKGVKKLGYYTLKLLIEKSRGCIGVGEIETGIPNIHLFYFEGNNRYVVWWDYYKDSVVRESKEVILFLPKLETNTVKITDAVPYFPLDFQTKQSRLKERDYPRFFGSSLKSVDGNRAVILNLGKSPVYIE